MQERAVKKILHFWFGYSENEQAVIEQRELWWGKSADIDNYIREQFQEDVSNAIAGRYNHWLERPDSNLALIILADQFSRHIYRNTPTAFAADPLAFQWAKDGIELKHDKQLNVFERTFFYMPFEHAEDLSAQQQSVALFLDLSQRVSASQQKLFEDYYIYAKQHQVIIERFGRFPHRNEILKRDSTEDEKKFLTEPNSRF